MFGLGLNVSYIASCGDLLDSGRETYTHRTKEAVFVFLSGDSYAMIYGRFHLPTSFFLLAIFSENAILSIQSNPFKHWYLIV